MLSDRRDQSPVRFHAPIMGAIKGLKVACSEKSYQIAFLKTHDSFLSRKGNLYDNACIGSSMLP
jgi:hypothetical protein